MFKALKEKNTLDQPQSGGEPELREKFVKEQRKIEEGLVNNPNGRADFFVEFPLTPLYIDHNAIEQDQVNDLFIINPKSGYTIPEGLIPTVKLNDPAQLSTVLGRVLSLWKLKENPIIVFYVTDRENVATHQFEIFKKQHPITFIKINKQEDYLPFKGIIAEATMLILKTIR